MNPIRAMGWSNCNLTKVWKLVFPLTKMSAELGFLPLTDPTWGLIPNPLMIGLHSIAREMEMGVLEHVLTFCPGKGQASVMSAKTGWNLR